MDDVRIRYVALMVLLLMSQRISAQVTYERSDSVTVCRLLQQAPKDAGTLWFARRFLGVPYVAHTLEVNSTEQLVVNTRQMDCITLVETVMTLAWCKKQGKCSWEDYLSTLRLLRYRQGKVEGYASRLHYFSDWIDDNEALQLVKEIQKPNPPFTEVQHISLSYMSEHPQAYKALRTQPALVDIISQQERALTGQQRRYIPKAAVRNSKVLRQTIHDGDIIAITCNKKGLDIAHLGFAVWHHDGLHLLNASQLRKRVVEEPMTLGRYLQKHPSHTGIRVIRMNKNNKR